MSLLLRMIEQARREEPERMAALVAQYGPLAVAFAMRRDGLGQLHFAAESE